MVEYIPDRGDIVFLDFDPQKGKEIKKTRPALVLSPKIYNQKTGLALFMPITSHIKNYPFEVHFKTDKVQGVILCDQIRSLDFVSRNAIFKTHLPKNLFQEVINKISLLLFD